MPRRSRRCRNEEPDKKAKTSAIHHRLRLRLRSREESRWGQFRTMAQARGDRLASWVTLAKAPAHFPTVEDSYETPTVDDELLSALRAAVGSVSDLREAYLV